MWFIKYLYNVFIINKVLFFLLSVFIFTIVPGFLLHSIIFNRNERSSILKKIPFSFFLGSFINFLLYFILYYLKSLYYLIIINIVIDVLLLLFCVIKKINLKVSFNIHWFCYTNLVVFVIFSFIILWMSYPVKNIVIHQDYLFQIKNINALSHGKILDFSIYGVDFHYHFFNNLFFAYHKILSGCEGFYMYLIGQTFILPIVLNTAICYIVSKYSNNKVIISILCIDMILLASEISFTTSNNITHILGNINAVGLSISLCILIYDIIIDNYKNNKISNSIWIGLSFFLLTGWKGTFAASLLLALWGTFVIRLIKKKVCKNEIVMLFISSLVFLLTYRFIVYSPSQSSLFLNGIENIGSIVEIDLILKRLAILLGKFIPLILLKILLFPIWIFFTFGIFAVIFVLIVLRDKFNIFNTASFLLFVSFFIGVTACYVIHVDGFSELYFRYFAIVPLIYIVVFNVDIFGMINSYFLKMIGTLMIFFSIFFGLIIIYNQIIKNINIWKNICDNKGEYKNLELKYEEGGIEPERVPYDSKYFFTQNEVLGLEYLKDNSYLDEVFATNRHYLIAISNSHARYFYDTVFSDRQAYIEGFSYSDRARYLEYEHITKDNDKLFSNDLTEKEKYDYCVKNDISYLVCHIKHLNNYFVESDFFIIKYKNEDIVILERKNNM